MHRIGLEWSGLLERDSDRGVGFSPFSLSLRMGIVNWDREVFLVVGKGWLSQMLFVVGEDGLCERTRGVSSTSLRSCIRLRGKLGRVRGIIDRL